MGLLAQDTGRAGANAQRVRIRIPCAQVPMDQHGPDAGAKESGKMVHDGQLGAAAA